MKNSYGAPLRKWVADQYRLKVYVEEASCKAGIGVATGADKVFIGDYAALDVEPECKLPLVTTRDIQSGEVQWRGQGVINPFGELYGSASQ